MVYSSKIMFVVRGTMREGEREREDLKRRKRNLGLE
jgi:hypothetical protein